MLKKNPLLVFFLVLVTVLVLGFAYKIFGERYFGAGGSDLPEGVKQNQNVNGKLDGTVDKDNSTQGANENFNPAKENQNENSNTNASADGLPTVGPKDCENRCADFSGENLDYCREVCGLKAKNVNSSSGDCSDKSGLAKDYCLRDLAVSKKDFKFCDQVGDAKIKKNCRDRVTEELLD